MNPFEILGVPQSASDETIRKAYLKLVRQNTPYAKKDPGDREKAEAKLKEINAAYAQIGTAQKRTQWAARKSEKTIDPFGFGDFSQHQNILPYDINVTASLTLTLKDVLKAAQKGYLTFEYSLPSECTGCGGTAIENPRRCTGCNGRGVTMETLLIFTRTITCRMCRGRGVVGNSCRRCSGKGYQKKTGQVQVPLHYLKIANPLRFQSRGGYYKTYRGDLVLQFKFERSENVWVQDGLVHYRIKVPYSTLLLRQDIRDPLVGLISLPTVLHTGRPLPLARKGVDLLRGRVAPLLLHLDAEIPFK